MKKVLLILIIFIYANNLCAQDSQVDKEKERTAIGDAKFEMTWEDAVKCNVFNQKPKFKKFKIKENRYLVADNYILGNRKYRVRCVFEDDVLDEVTISSYLLSAQYYDKDIRNSFLNLKEIFTKAYGAPFYDPGYPTILDHEKASSHTMWVYGEKVISLSIEKNDYQYYTYMKISLVNSSSVKRLRETARDLLENIEESSKLF